MAEIRAQLQKILASQIFSGSGRMSRFLEFTVEEALQGRGDDLKEYKIGLEVFDRDASYDPRIDPIVRVEARRLRSKLERYYETEGRDDPISIDYPKGRYLPVIQPREAAARAAAEPAAIAVLPFANLSSDPENEYFSDGLTEELIHALTKVEGLRVVAWNSAFQFKGKGEDVREIGRQLKVGTILEGSVRRAGARIRVSAQLLRVADGQYLWSQVYEREMKDIFAIQDEISRAIVETLRIRLAGALVKGYTENLHAYTLYLRGRYHWNRRTEEGLTKAIDYFEQAIAMDPRYAPAISGLADSYNLLGHYGLAKPADVMPKAKAAAMRALEIDDTLAEAHASFAYVRSLYEWQWEDAGQHYRRAIELNPSYATAQLWYGMDYLAPLGRLDEALEWVRRAQQLDPLSLIVGNCVGAVYAWRREYDKAIEEHRKTLDLDPYFYRAYMGLGRSYLQQGLHQEALDCFEKGRQLSGGAIYTCGQVGETLALSGRRDEARKVVEELIELSRRRYVACTTIALVYIGLGEKDRAFEWLERGCEHREIPLVQLGVHPAYDSLRSDPRLGALMKRVGLEK